MTTATEPTTAGGWRTARSAAVLTALAAATAAPFWVLLQHQQAQGRSAAALSMPTMHMENTDVFWAFPIIQASGVAALLWSYVGVLLGLLQADKRPSWWPWSGSATLRTHRHISLIVLALILVHAVATAYDAMGDSWLSAFVPGQTSWHDAETAYTVGILGLYFAVLLGPTYYLRKFTGVRVWRFLHRFVLVVYVLSVWHTLLLGADFSHYEWVRPVTWLAQIPLLVLFARRTWPGQAQRGFSAALRYGSTVASAVVAAVVFLLVLTGNSDLPEGVHGGGHHHSSEHHHH